MQIKKEMTKTTLALLVAATLSASIVEASPRDVSASTSVELRLTYLEKLLHSKTGQRLKENQASVATATEQLLAEAREALDKGDSQRADQLAKQGLHDIMTATQALPQDPEEISRYKKRYENLRQGLNKFTYAESDNKERFNISESDHSYDQAQINKLVEVADAAAAKGEYEKAAGYLEVAQSQVTASLQNILNHKQLVIELDISTPQKEYYYELRRYLGYEDLIPVALEVKKPDQSVAEEMQRLGEKAKWMSDQAREKAIAEDYPVAIRMMMDATNVVQQALRMAGVSM